MLNVKDRLISPVGLRRGATLALTLAVVLMIMPGMALAVGERFRCNNVPYVGYAGQLYTIDMSTSPFKFTPIFNPLGTDLDGIGFDPIDGYLYAISSSGQIRRIDATGNQTWLGTPAGLQTGVSWAEGTFTADGTYVVITELASRWAKINVTTTPPTLIAQGTWPGNEILGDVAIDPITGNMYSWDNTNHYLVRVDLSAATPTVQRIGTQSFPNIVQGGAYFTSDGSFYVIYQGTGPQAGGPPNAYARIDLTTGVPTLVSDGQPPGAANQGQPPGATWPWDAASCPFTVTIQKEVASPVTPGRTTTVTLTIRNSSITPTVANLTDSLPTGQTYVAGSLSDTLGGTVNNYGGTGTLTITGMTMPARTTTTITVQVAVPSNATPGMVSNQATLDITAPAIEIDTVPSDDPSTPEVGDPTQYEVGPPEADLEMVSKGASPATVQTGQNISFPIQVRNNGPSNAANVSVTDTLPAGLTFVSTGSDPLCTATGSTVTCAIGTLAASDTRTLTIVAAVAAAAPAGPATNNASVRSSTTADLVPGNESKSSGFTIQRAADLGITKTGPSTATPGAAITYTLTVTNHGPSTSSGFTLTEAVPANVTGASVTATGCSLNLPVITCAGPLANGDTRVITVSGTVSTALPPPTFTNTATIAPIQAGEDTNAANDNASVTVTVPAAADLAIGINETTAPVAGGSGVYGITVTNNGPATAVAPTVTVPLPAGAPTGTQFDLDRTSATCTGSASGPLTCVLPDMANSATASLAVGLAFPANTPDNTSVTVTTSVSSTTLDPITANNTASTTSTVQRDVDLAIAVVGGPDPVAAGSPFTYTVSVRNFGPADSTGAVVTMPLPPALAGATTPTPGCSIVSNELRCALNLAAGAPTTVITVAGTVDAATSGGTPLNVIATIAAGTGETDTLMANNTSTFRSTVTSTTALSIGKTGTATAVAGQAAPVTFTVTATNAGPSTATGATVTDTLPAGLTLVSAVPTQGTCTTARPFVCSLGTMTSNQSVTITVTATVASSVAHGAILTNTVGFHTDQAPDDITATSSVAVSRSADIQVSKSGPATVVAGEQATYTVTVTNAGPSDSAGVTLSELLPPGLTFDSATGATCDTGDTGATCDLGPIAHNGSVTVTISADVASAVTHGASLTNQAVATVTGPDPNMANNSASSTATAQRSYDLAVTKRVASSPVIAGAPVTFELTVTNTGPSDATAVTVTDTLPAGFTLATPTSSGCAAGTGQDVVCTLPSVVEGTPVVLTITADVSDDVALGSHDNFAFVAAADGGTDSNPNNNTVTVPVTVQAEADLSLLKVPGGTPLPFIAGAVVTYGLAVTNGGPSPATGVVVTDVLPAGATFNAAASDPGCTADGQTVTCTVGGLAHGDSTTVTVGAAIAPDVTGSLRNGAHVTATTADTRTDNNDAAATAPVTAATRLTLTKTPSTDTPIAGATFQYALRVVNEGPSTTPSIEVTDTLPDGLSFVSGTGCTTTGDTVRCTHAGALAPHSAYTFTTTVRVAADALANAPLANTATATTPITLLPDSDNADSATVRPVGVADIALAKSASPTTVKPGGTITYRFTLTNRGPSVSTVDALTDTLPAGLTYVSYSASNNVVRCRLLGREVLCDVIRIKPGERVTIDLVVRVAADATPGPRVNSAIAETSVLDPVTGDHTASVAIEVSRPSIPIVVPPTPSVPSVPAVPGIPVTGSRLGPIVAVGSVLSAVGVLLLGLARRRRRPLPPAE